MGGIEDSGAGIGRRCASSSVGLFGELMILVGYYFASALHVADEFVRRAFRRRGGKKA